MSTAELGLTQELEKLVNGFQAMPDDKMRYKQLLFMASKAEEMAPELKTPENKVQGCLSTVHVHAVKRDGLVFYQGDSDGLLTKGLVTILVRGLSGNSPEDIQQVKPEFIKAAGLATSLTPGRNNGFINMLAKMKKVAVELQDTPAEAEPTEPQAQEEIQEQNEAPAAAAENSRPIYSAMMAKLSILKPALLEVTDDSAGHAGHKEAQNIQSDESHFSVKIVGSCFEGLSLVKRHQLVYTVLAEEMKTIHAIQINAKTPEEVGL
eukprot:CAMPEP_0117744006 /NCGR_PEP_ID=MMETSP0947-20121206/6486_1 /TAXON_ID=44440 /ORGANISM="Chattonella subsalsa, Strain CCMP2191" /LENGTH=263 /DNA_ID=CAMNT_0005560841 /DNA_START=355 /DNA_END=1146 /DNA_ORIENTATION=+